MYTAIYEQGNLIGEETIQPIDQLNREIKLIGDVHLINQEKSTLDLVQHFYDLKDKWILQEDVDHVKPNYLKANEAYLIK